MRAIFDTDLHIDNLENFLAYSGTQAFIINQDDHILCEKFLNGVRRDSIVTSLSVAKSITSALIGIASVEGFIHNVDDPITN